MLRHVFCRECVVHKNEVHICAMCRKPSSLLVPIPHIDHFLSACSPTKYAERARHTIKDVVARELIDSIREAVRIELYESERALQLTQRDEIESSGVLVPYGVPPMSWPYTLRRWRFRLYNLGCRLLPGSMVAAHVISVLYIAYKLTKIIK